MVFQNTILYPKGAGPTFDMKYYLATHMPLVADSWKPYGLKSWTIVQFGPGPDGAEPEYCVQATLEWDSPESFQKALGGPEKDKVFGDIPNFSNAGPVLLGGQVTGTG